MIESQSYLSSIKRRKLRFESGTLNVSIPKKWANLLNLRAKQPVFLHLNLDDSTIRIYYQRPERTLTNEDIRYEKRKIRKENGTLNVSIPVDWLGIACLDSNHSVQLQANVKSKLIYVFYNKSE